MAYRFFVSCAFIVLLGSAALVDAQEKKLERMRIGGGSATEIVA
jgi:hypothetical protein